jgi:acetyl esterase
MSLDVHVKALLDQMAAMAVPKMWELGPQAARAAMRLRMPGMAETPVGRIENRTIPGPANPIAVRIYSPLEHNAPTLPGLVFFHGGGFVIGDLDTHDDLCRVLANESGCRVVSVDYRLAPEHPFPAALDDAVAATAWVCAHATDLGAAAGPVVIGGESAGGNLAAVTCLQARSDPRIAIRYQVLLQPVVDFALTFPSIAMKETECLVPREDLAWYYETYAGAAHDMKDSRLSPLYATDVSRLPPALIIAAEYDTLRDEAGAYAERLQAASVPARCSCYPGMIHGFLQMGGLVPDDAQAAISEIARAIN